MAKKTASKSKAKSKAKAKGMTASERKAFTASDGVKAKGTGSKAKSGDGAALVTVGVGKKAHTKTTISAEQLATRLGISGKRLRGVLRQGEYLGNDGRYSHYAFDTASKDFKALEARLKSRFKLAG